MNLGYRLMAILWLLGAITFIQQGINTLDFNYFLLSALFFLCAYVWWMDTLFHEVMDEIPEVDYEVKP